MIGALNPVSRFWGSEADVQDTNAIVMCYRLLREPAARIKSTIGKTVIFTKRSG